MTAPQTKFFDIVKKVFPENQHSFHTDHMGRIWRWDGYILKYAANIIAVPFTGFLDLYVEDLFFANGRKFKVQRDKGTNGFEGKHLTSGDFYTLLLLKHDIHRGACNDFKIIGSSLTNPELLENK